jgi:hypothetical protein
VIKVPVRRTEWKNGSGGHGAVLAGRLLLVGCLLLGGHGVPGVAATASASDGGEDATVTGEVLDTACYVAHGRKGAGPGHKKCAIECIKKKDFPISVLTEDGDVILILPDHADEGPYEDLKEKAAQTVTVEGRMITRGGLKALVLSGIK